MKLVLALTFLSALFHAPFAQAGGDIAQCKSAAGARFVDSFTHLEYTFEIGSGEVSILVNEARNTFIDAQIKVLSYELISSQEEDESDVYKTYAVKVALVKSTGNKKADRALTNQVFTCELNRWHK